MEGANPVIEWCKPSDKLCLKFVFRGHLTTEEAKLAVDKWRQAFLEKNGAQIILVWDCLDMAGYSRKARSVWTHAMLDLKPQIAAIWLISNSSLVKMGASVMALLSGLHVHIVKSEGELREALTPSPTFFTKKTNRDDRTDSRSF
jgi:hypothetical protein